LKDDLAGPNSPRQVAGDGFREIVDIDEDAPTASAQRIDQFVTRDRKQG
jgi:hypothetical protein